MKTEILCLTNFLMYFPTGYELLLLREQVRYFTKDLDYERFVLYTARNTTSCVLLIMHGFYTWFV